MAEAPEVSAVPILSLKARSLLKATEGMNIPQILRFCDSRTDYRDICYSGVDFWKRWIEIRHGNMVIIQRPDLTTAEEWIKYAKGFLPMKRIPYIATFTIVQGEVMQGTRLKRDRGEESLQGDIVIQFNVIGLRLPRGMQMWVVYFEEQGEETEASYFPEQSMCLTWIYDFLLERLNGETPEGGHHDAILESQDYPEGHPNYFDFTGDNQADVKYLAYKYLRDPANSNYIYITVSGRDIFIGYALFTV
ncbi:MAG: hypothetical protein ACMG6E_01220 [Candidatus Roizmanbacteria bacterium]